MTCSLSFLSVFDLLISKFFFLLKNKHINKVIFGIKNPDHVDEIEKDINNFKMIDNEKHSLILLKNVVIFLLIFLIFGSYPLILQDNLNLFFEFFIISYKFFIAIKILLIVN